MTDRPSIAETARALDAVGKRLILADGIERNELLKEFRRLLAVIDAMVANLNDHSQR